MSRAYRLEESARLLEEYTGLTAAARAAATAFMRQEAEALACGRKTKCFVLISPEEAAVKAGEGRVVFREPTQKHHVVFEQDGSKTKGLARPGTFLVSLHELIFGLASGSSNTEF